MGDRSKYFADYYKKNKEKMDAATKAYYKNNPEAKKVANKKYRDKVKSNKENKNGTI